MKGNLGFTQKQPPEVFYAKGVLRNLTKFTRKHLCQSFFFNKAGLNFAAFLRTLFLQNTSERLLLFTLDTSKSGKMNYEDRL